jgi:hypothetical protein
LLEKYKEFEKQYENKKEDEKFFEEWSSICFKLFKKDKIKFKDALKIAMEGLSINPKNAYLLSNKKNFSIIFYFIYFFIFYIFYFLFFTFYFFFYRKKREDLLKGERKSVE